MDYRDFVEQVKEQIRDYLKNKPYTKMEDLAVVWNAGNGSTDYNHELGGCGKPYLLHGGKRNVYECQRSLSCGYAGGKAGEFHHTG